MACVVLSQDRMATGNESNSHVEICRSLEDLLCEIESAGISFIRPLPSEPLIRHR